MYDLHWFSAISITNLYFVFVGFIMFVAMWALCHRMHKWPSSWAYIGGGKLLETSGAIYTKPLVERVWKLLEEPKDVHTSLHYGGRHERSLRLSREFQKSLVYSCT